MASCTSCGNDVTGKKFCPQCGTPVQPAGGSAEQPASTSVCPRCNGVVKQGAAFCMHCGSSLSTQTAVATSTPSQPATRTCIACHAEVPAGMAFCTNCGQNMQVSATPATPASVFCTNCGRQNNPGVNFCAGCGSPITQMPEPRKHTTQHNTLNNHLNTTRKTPMASSHSSTDKWPINQWSCAVPSAWQCHP